MCFILKVKSEIRGEKDGIRALKKGKRGCVVALIVSRAWSDERDERERAMRHVR